MARKEKLILLGTFFLTVFLLLLGWTDVMCIRNESPAEAITQKVMVVGSIMAFFVYWVLWFLWDENKWAKNRKLHRILFFSAAGLSLTKFIYMNTLCPAHQEVLDHWRATAPETTITDLSDIEF